jgi:hypothetical protein
MAQEKMPIIDPTGRADGDHVYWDATAGVHKYEAPGAGGGAGGLIGIQRFSTAGSYTYTPTAGTNAIIIELVGGGGGGSACVSAGGSAVAVGGGGGGGAWLRKRLTADFSGATVVVGAKGAKGASGANNSGGAGTASTFTDTNASPTTYTAGGGAGGVTRGGGPVQLTPSAAGGTASGGDDNVDGGYGDMGIGFGGPFYAKGGGGGASRYSPGAKATHVAANPGQGAGTNANGYGGGGSGAVVVGSGSTQAGGDGSVGLVIVWEYA